VASREVSLSGLEKNAKDMYRVSLELLRKVLGLVTTESPRERERLLGEIEDGAALLDVLRRSSTEAILLFAMRYQPLGRDFKWVHSLLGVVYDMFRIGRYCREIALADRYVSRLSEESLRDLKEVVELAIEAYENAYRAFFEGCASCVDRVKEIDSRVDSLYMGLLKEVGSAGVVPSTTVAKVLVLRHIERVVDHIVNIALSN
jgi:phosphate transport system protein